MHYFLPYNVFWDSSKTIFMLIGLGVFTFISGLLIDFNYSEKVQGISDIVDFYKNRAIRILPLNWISILFSLFIGATFVPFIIPTLSANYSIANINPLGIANQLIGSQLLVQYSDSFNWFVSLIVICYLIYPLLAWFAKNTVQTIIISLLPMIFFVFARVSFGLIDDRLLIYYLVFIGGVMANRIKQKWSNYTNKKMFICFAACATSSFIYFWRGGNNFYNQPLFGNPFANFVVYDVVLLDCATIFGCISLLLLLNTKRIRAVLEKCVSSLAFVALSAYCVYLFHFPFFTIGLGLANYLQLPTMVTEILFYLVVVPLTFLLSYIIQAGERRFRISMKRCFSSRNLSQKPLNQEKSRVGD
jgi:peptidoglycan/LPS O-acetylase OafA/YrhL